jgi:hypothetical protein
MNAQILFRTALLAAASLVLPAEVHTQGRVTPAPATTTGEVKAAPSPRYGATAAHEFFLGRGWRDLWQTPLTMPVLNLDTFAGGLKPEREGGNKQSITLHMVDAKGRGWVFRSMDKYPSKQINDGQLEGTLAGSFIQDQIGATYPTAPLMLPPLLDALGILHIESNVYVIPDDPKNLGEFHKTFAGMIGMLEAKPLDGEKELPGFEGSTKAVDAKDLLEELEKSSANVFAQRELLRSRLLDFIIGDTDRTTDNYRFVRFPHPHNAGRHVWRPAPRDRDWAFHRAGGLLIDAFGGPAFPKFVSFGPRHSKLKGHTFSTHVMDRRLLTGLDRVEFQTEVAIVKQQLTDDVINAAVQRLPATYPQSHKREVAEAMKARRNSLDGIAAQYYAWLATDVDVHASDEAEVATIERRADGSVFVSIAPAAIVVVTTQNGNGDSSEESATRTRAPFYGRLFRPGETREVRVFLRGGDDAAVVRGPGQGIAVRVIGGGGNDVLTDSAVAGGVYFYDAEGDNQFVRTSHTHVDTREWVPADPPEGLRNDVDWAPDWGRGMSMGVAFDHGVASGIVIGGGPTWKAHAFRRTPYHWKVDAHALISTETREPGVEIAGDYRFENSPHSIEGLLRWSGYDGFRWFGLGNNTPELEEPQSLVHMNRFSVEPAFVYRFGQWRRAADEEEEAATEERKDQSAYGMRGSLSIGPVLRYTTTDAADDGVLAIGRLGFEPLWQAGAAARFELRNADRPMVPRRGYRVRATVAGYPALLDQPGAYATARAEVNGYIPLIGNGPHLALRLGGMRAVGDFPAFDAAYAGGRSTLRGFSSRRFAGDAAAFGSAELRVPIGNVRLLVPGELGVFAHADAGRAWLDGESPGGWHKGYGGGLWFEAFQRSVSAAYSTGEKGKLYLWFGMPF